MKNDLRIRPYRRAILGFSVFLFALSFVYVVGKGGFFNPHIGEAKITPETVLSNNEEIVFDKSNPQVQTVMDVQDRHTPKLMAIPEVVGSSIGLTDDGRPAILVFTKNRVSAGVVPESLEGVPVVVRVTGEISAMPSQTAGKGSPSNVVTINPKSFFQRPVPIGISTGNANECSAGTIGARVKDRDGYVYALSNNHVYALENTASIGSVVLQPGLYDTRCVYNPNNSIGTLYAYEPIKFDGSNNEIDSAIALTTTGLLGNSTPSNGYGTPSSTTRAASVGLPVQKYGRTTSLTRGAINAINATVKVGYGSGTAIFMGQVIVYSSKPFIKAGDSGSLLVSDDASHNPVGLLFAGTSDGKWAIANPIDKVLARFGVGIDGN